MDASDQAHGFAGVTYDEAMRRGRELVPFLQERAGPAEDTRRMTGEIEAELHRTGLLRILQPKRWGGM